MPDPVTTDSSNAQPALTAPATPGEANPSEVAGFEAAVQPAGSVTAQPAGSSPAATELWTTLRDATNHLVGSDDIEFAGNPADVEQQARETNARINTADNILNTISHHSNLVTEELRQIREAGGTLSQSEIDELERFRAAYSGAMQGQSEAVMKTAFDLTKAVGQNAENENTQRELLEKMKTWGIIGAATSAVSSALTVPGFGNAESMFELARAGADTTISVTNSARAGWLASQAGSVEKTNALDLSNKDVQLADGVFNSFNGLVDELKKTSAANPDAGLDAKAFNIFQSQWLMGESYNKASSQIAAVSMLQGLHENADTATQWQKIPDSNGNIEYGTPISFVNRGLDELGFDTVASTPGSYIFPDVDTLAFYNEAKTRELNGGDVTDLRSYESLPDPLWSGWNIDDNHGEGYMRVYNDDDGQYTTVDLDAPGSIIQEQTPDIFNNAGVSYWPSTGNISYDNNLENIDNDIEDLDDIKMREHAENLVGQMWYAITYQQGEFASWLFSANDPSVPT